MTTQAVIHRFSLPIDDRPHGIDLTGDIFHAAVRRPGHVDVWYQARPENVEHMRRSFQVVGTGQPLPIHFGTGLAGGHRGTAITPDGLLVWHVLENYCSHPLPAPEEMSESEVIGTECPGCGVGLSGKPGLGWQPI